MENGIGKLRFEPSEQRESGANDVSMMGAPWQINSLRFSM